MPTASVLSRERRRQEHQVRRGARAWRYPQAYQDPGIHAEGLGLAQGVRYGEGPRVEPQDCDCREREIKLRG
eukprot:6522142-Alexandrium_andersonii.AAC.1